MKNLLIITQKVDEDDDVLGFFHEWIAEFAKHFSLVTVICLYRGSYSLPNNVRVVSLGKETRRSKIQYFLRFYKYIWKYRRNYDAIFVHMNPVYVVLGGLFWHLWGKTTSLWYAHGHVPSVLRLADKLTDIAFASTPEGYRLKSSKLRIVGQGIDTDKFKPSLDTKTGDLRIVSVGRISPSKDYATLFRAIKQISEDVIKSAEIFGSPATEKDGQYLLELKDIVKNYNLEKIVKFKGSVPNKDLVPILQNADLFVNMSHTGSLDKANLEAMSCGLVLLTCNEAFKNVLGVYADNLMYEKGNDRELAGKIEAINLLGTQKRRELGLNLRNIIIKNHTLTGLIYKISSILKK